MSSLKLSFHRRVHDAVRRRSIASLARASLLFVFCACMVPGPAWGADEKGGTKNGSTKKKKAEKPKRRPLVVLKQTAIAGKVFFLTDEDQQDTAAGELFIQVRTADGKEEITFIIDGSLPGPGDLGKARRGRRRGR